MPRPRRVLPFLLAATALAGGAGCVHVPAWQQRFVAQPGMIFSDSPALTAPGALLAQVEPGRAAAGGAQPVGCSSCR